MTGAGLPHFVPGLGGAGGWCSGGNAPRFYATGRSPSMTRRNGISVAALPCERSANYRDARASHLPSPSAGWRTPWEGPSPALTSHRDAGGICEGGVCRKVVFLGWLQDGLTPRRQDAKRLRLNEGLCANRAQRSRRRNQDQPIFPASRSQCSCSGLDGLHETNSRYPNFRPNRTIKSRSVSE